MRIALVTETYPPEVNGVAMTLLRLVGGLRERGHRVTVFRPRQRSEAKDAVGGEDEVVVPGAPLPFYDALRIGLPVVGRLRRLWTQERPDVIHVATEGPLGWAALRVGRQLGIPVTSTFHTNFHHYSDHYGLRPLQKLGLGYLRWFHNRTACTLVPTPDIRDMLVEDGFARVGILSRGVDTALFDPAHRSLARRRSWGVTGDEPVVIYVGRMAAEKNLALAVQAFLTFRETQPTAHFVLVGDGPERAALAAQHPEFHYAGMQRGADLAECYASADLFFFASTTETFGNVITEAMASGLVVQAFNYAAGRLHVRSGENGFLVDEVGDAPAFLEGVRAIAGDVAAWSAVRAAARHTAEGITWAAVVAGFESDLRQAASTGMPGA